MILSYGLWQEQFGGDPAALGRTIQLDNAPYTIIGVMPNGFYFPTREARLWTAMRWPPEIFEDRTNTYIFPVGRLKPGVTVAQARAEMRTIGAQLARAYPKELAHVGVAVVRFRDDVSDRSRLMLKVLLGAALCVLLIACTNLANLLLARAMVRRRELAVRTALGAGRERLVRQMLTESLLLSIAGGVLGLLLAQNALPLLVRLTPVSLPIAEVPRLDARVLLFAALVTFATGIGFGILPALRTGLNTATALHEGGRSGAGGRRERLRSALVITQVACSIVLLVGFGLLTRALWRIQAVDPGFRADHVLTLRTSLPMPQYKDAATRDPFYRHVLDEARRLPGVTAAAYTSFLPVAMGGGIWPVQIEGHPEDVANRRTASLRFVTPGFFQAMGIPLLGGRDVRETDAESAPYVAVVSQSFVRRYWPGENADRPAHRYRKSRSHHHRSRRRRSRARSRTQQRAAGLRVMAAAGRRFGLVRSQGPRRSHRGRPVVAGRRAAANHSSRPTRISRSPTCAPSPTLSRRTRRRGACNWPCSARSARWRSCSPAVGIHGLLAFAVSSRTAEIGVRVALGAQRRDILTLTVGEGVRLALSGIGMGMVLAYFAGRLLQSLLAGVSPWDPATFAAAVLLSLAMTGGGNAAARAARPARRSYDRHARGMITRASPSTPPRPVRR